MPGSEDYTSYTRQTFGTDGKGPGGVMLETLDDEGKPPPSRIRDSTSAHAICTRLTTDDELAAYDRACCDRMMNGEPPYNQKLLNAQGRGDEVNVNFMEASANLEKALAPYIEIVENVPCIARCNVTFGDLNTRTDFTNLVSNAFDKVLKGWQRFDNLTLMLATYYVGKGIGITYWEDDRNWQWNVASIGDFLFPRDTPCYEEAIEVAVCRRDMPVHELYDFIRDEKKAAQLGWNVDETKRAIIDADTTHQGATTDFATRWEKFVQLVKENDYYVGHGLCNKVKVNHLYAQEFDQSVSHYILRRDGTGNDFLYQRRGLFKSVTNAFVVYTYGVGSGTYHTVRGQAYKMYNLIQLSNRMRSQTMNAAFFASCIPIQPRTADDIENINLIRMGPYYILPPNTTFPVVPNMNVSTQIMPVIQDLSRVLETNILGYKGINLTEQNLGSRPSKYQVQAVQQDAASLSVAQMNLWYRPYSRTLTEAFRRVIRKGYSAMEKGGEAVKSFRKELVDAGIPEGILQEVLESVKVIEPVRSIGNGSPQMRQLSIQRVLELSSQFDEVGRKEALRDAVASEPGVGYGSVDRFVPRGDPRPVPDEKVAELEESSFTIGKQIPVQSTENHVIHANIHIQGMTQALQQLQQQQTTPGKVLPYLEIDIQHTIWHSKWLDEDLSRKVEAGQVRKAIQNIGAISAQMRQHVDAQNLAAEQAMQEQGTPNPVEDAKAQKIMQDAALEAAHAHARLQWQEEEHMQRMRLADATAAHEITKSLIANGAEKT